jgi:hypothetical protein
MGYFIRYREGYHRQKKQGSHHIPDPEPAASLPPNPANQPAVPRTSWRSWRQPPGWIDRFYYEYYSPWRATHEGLLEELEGHALTVLGAREKSCTPPDITWLPPQNPLHAYPELRQAVQDGRLEVFFWVETFGLAYTWALFPDSLMVSFAEPGVIYENFMTFVSGVAERTKGLADPTRLTILPMIRHFGRETELILDLNSARMLIANNDQPS